LVGGGKTCCRQKAPSEEVMGEWAPEEERIKIVKPDETIFI
jgi:hypothetical protein